LWEVAELKIFYHVTVHLPVLIHLLGKFFYELAGSKIGVQI
jgi:hypothetical protein